MRKLMGYLAQFNSFLSQGEVLCTQSLTYLLEDTEASSVFSKYLSERVGTTIAPLTWKAEVSQKDGGRCDLEGSAGGIPLVKIEAKLGAPFGQDQLRSYVEDLRARCGSGGSLLVLVPRQRASEISMAVCSTFNFLGDGPWSEGASPTCSVCIIFWEDVLAALSTVKSETFSSDFAQFHALYRALRGFDIKLPTKVSELLKWRKKPEDKAMFISLVDHVSRRLTQKGDILPMGKEGGVGVQEYNRRYVCRPLGTDEPCFSVGACDPFEGYETPIWMRFHRSTPKFSVIRDRLVDSSFSRRLVESHGHIWIPLDVPLDARDGEQLVDSLLARAEDVIQVAYQPLC